MPELSEEVKTFIVQAHACFRKPSLIKKNVQAEFGIEVSRNLILNYHPERGAKNKRLAKKWIALFWETRKEFLDGKVVVGLAVQTGRLQLFQRAADYYEERGEMVLAGDMAVLIAKDIGGAYTNRRELTGQGGGPIVTAGMTHEQWLKQASTNMAEVDETMAAFDGEDE